MSRHQIGGEPLRQVKRRQTRRVTNRLRNTIVQLGRALVPCEYRNISESHPLLGTAVVARQPPIIDPERCAQDWFHREMTKSRNGSVVGMERGLISVPTVRMLE